MAPSMLGSCAARHSAVTVAAECKALHLAARAGCQVEIAQRPHNRQFAAHAAQPLFAALRSPKKLRERSAQDGVPVAYDVVGLGQAMVDYSGMVSSDCLHDRQLSAGGRRVIDVEERARLIDELKGDGFQLNAGGSLANTLAGLARLAGAEYQRQAGSPYRSPPLKVGMTGCIGDDHLGDFFRSQFNSAGVHWISEPAPGTGTGTVIVLTTADAQRSFLSYPGSSTSLDICPAAAAAIASSRLLIIEGYLWEFPDAAEAIERAIDIAREAGATVAMTVADVSVVQRHGAEMLESIKKADIVFTNRAEATELIRLLPEDHLISNESPHFGAEAAAKQLGSLCPVAVVTDGSKGSCITAVGQLYVVPPDWSRDAPLDTCGAGDAYAAGFLHAFLSGMNIHQMGEFAASTASKVIHRMGPQLSADDAEVLLASRPEDPRFGTSIVGPLSRHAERAFLV